MTQEEKARAYDEIVNKLRRFITHGVDPLITRADVQDFFPELKESEDERIRDILIAFFGEWAETRSHFRGIPINDVKAWLKKQGNDSYLQEKIENFTNAHKGEDPEGIIAACRGGEKQGGQKHSNLESIGEDWSEEDEENLYLTVVAIQEKYSGELFLDKKKVKEQVGTGRKLLDWLYSFRDRVKPQPKQDWSEEDEIIRKTLTNIVNIFYEGCFGKAERNLLLNWLKYLKERVQPKQEWSEDDEKEWKSIVSVLTRMHFLDELDWLRNKLNR